MPTTDDIKQQQNQLSSHRITLGHYLKQLAINSSAHAPPVISHGILEARAGIARCKAILCGWNIEVEDLPDDDEKPVNQGHEIPPRTVSFLPIVQLIRPETYGRKEILDQAKNYLRASSSVLLWGSPGNGQHGIALAICADLQQESGYVPLLRGPDIESYATVEQFASAVERFFRQHDLGSLSSQMTSPLTPLLGVGEREKQLREVCERIINALETAQEGFLLCLSLEHAELELRTFVGELARGLRRTPLLVVADYPVEKLGIRHIITIPPLGIEEVRRYVVEEGLLLDDMATLRLHELSFGLPALLLHVLNDSKAVAKRAGISLHEAIMAMDQHRQAASFAGEIFNQQPESFRCILEIDALIARYTPEVYDDVVALFVTINRSTAAMPVNELPALIERYGQLLNNHNLAELLRGPALESISTLKKLQPICLRIADFYENPSVLTVLQTLPYPPNSAYLIARYAALAQQWPRAESSLVDITHDTPLSLYGSWCASIYQTACDVLKVGVQYYHNGDILRELAGDCAMYLGQYREAAGHYEQIIARLPKEDMHGQHLNLRLIQAYNACGDKDQTQKASRRLLRLTRRTAPIHALGKAYEGVALITSDPIRAGELLQDAVKLLEKTRSKWPDTTFYMTELARLYEYLARAYILQGEYDKAIQHLDAAGMSAASELKNRHLTAVIDNTFGVLYFNRAQDNDLALSQAALTSSYDARKALGDLIGQMRILRNLSVLVFALAKEAKDWDAAEEKYLEIETLAERLEEDAPMQADDRALHLVNRLDLKIVRGDLVAARGLLDSAKTQPGIDDNTLILLLINQAKLALSEGDAETCHVYLARVLEAIEGGKHIVNNLEWIELTLEGHLLLDMPIDTARISPILAQQQPTDTYQSEAASWLFSEGLLAFILGDYSRAMGSLAQSRTLWKEVGYRYREATTALWQVDLLYRQGEIDSAHSIGYETQALLLPFGSTPALARLHKLQEM